MHTESIEHWLHDHTFGQDRKKSSEKRTLIVIIITALMMIVEIAAGLIFGSMALLADGLHMGSHASALTISAFAYYYTRSRAKDTRFNFGTGKVNSLAGFASAVMLAIFALVMAWESIKRFFSPVGIEFNQAIFVAVVGLVVNGICLVILGGRDDAHQHDEHETHYHEHHVHEHRDHNLWAAYIHVLADALTSVLAIFALVCAKFFGFIWLDPFMGIVGAFLVIRWSLGLLRSSARVLLDMQAPQGILDSIRRAIEAQGETQVCDLHVWTVGPGIYAAEIALVTSLPKPSDYYSGLLPREIPLVHVTVEVHSCPSPNV
jgi:cation diffusion facilitator family transporter